MPGRPRAALKVLDPLEANFNSIYCEISLALWETPGTFECHQEIRKALEQAGWALSRFGDRFRRNARIRNLGPWEEFMLPPDDCEPAQA